MALDLDLVLVLDLAFALAGMMGLRSAPPRETIHGGWVSYAKVSRFCFLIFSK